MALVRRRYWCCSEAKISMGRPWRGYSRYPDVRHVVLEEAEYLPWLQSPDAFRAELCAFFDC
jgi:hypothetical protein